MTTPKPLRIVVAINPSASFGKSRAVGPAAVQTLRAAGHDVTALTEPDFEELQEKKNDVLVSFQKELYEKMHAKGLLVTQDYTRR